MNWQADTVLGDVAYKALALYYFNEVSSRVQGDLNQEFKSYADPYFEVAKAKWTKWDEEEKAQPLSRCGLGLLASAFRRSQGEKERTPEDSANSETEGVKNKYIAAALEGIAQRRTSNQRLGYVNNGCRDARFTPGKILYLGLRELQNPGHKIDYRILTA